MVDKLKEDIASSSQAQTAKIVGVKWDDEQKPAQEKPEESKQTTKTVTKTVTRKSRSRSPQTTVKTRKSGRGKVTTTTTTTYRVGGSPIVKKIVTERKTKKRKVRSPTKRIIDIKNSVLDTKRRYQNIRDSDDRLLYTVSPTRSYIVDRVYDERFRDSYVDRDGKVVTRYYYGSPYSYRKKKTSKVRKSVKLLRSSPKRNTHYREIVYTTPITDSIGKSRAERRREIIERIHERSTQTKTSLHQPASDAK